MYKNIKIYVYVVFNVCVLCAYTHECSVVQTMCTQFLAESQICRPSRCSQISNTGITWICRVRHMYIVCHFATWGNQGKLARNSRNSSLRKTTFPHPNFNCICSITTKQITTLGPTLAHAGMKPFQKLNTPSF